MENPSLSKHIQSLPSMSAKGSSVSTSTVAFCNQVCSRVSRLVNCVKINLIFQYMTHSWRRRHRSNHNVLHYTWQMAHSAFIVFVGIKSLRGLLGQIIEYTSEKPVLQTRDSIAVHHGNSRECHIIYSFLKKRVVIHCLSNSGTQIKKPACTT